MSIEPTDDIKQANHDLTEHGLALYVGGLDPVATADVRERLLRAADLSEAHGVPTRGYPFDPDHHNRRVFNLFNLDSVFVDLIRDQLALNFVRHMIGEDFLISNFSGQYHRARQPADAVACRSGLRAAAVAKHAARMQRCLAAG